MTLGKKITLKNRILIGQSVNSNSLEGLVKLTRKVLKYTFTFEIIGAIFIAFEFVPIYGWGSGLFKSLFQSISAFCNAGFEVIGDSNMMPFVTNKIVNITCMILTTIGGLGFLVWNDISVCIKQGVKEKYNFPKIIKKFSLHTKIVLLMHMILFLFGTLIFFLFEYDNPGTIARFSLMDKFLISAFHSVSARTSGFASVNLIHLTDMTKLVMTLLMFIGAGSGSMAGGIKTTTIFVLIAGVYSNIVGKKNINVFKRTISNHIFMKVVSVITIALFVLMISNLFFIANSDIKTLDLLFESVSAFATVGLTSGALAKMNVICKGIIILLMYIGRIGTVTMALAFVMKKPKENDLIVYAHEDVIVG